ncbi:MAG: hypothetical protein M3Z96_09530 [Pseudomonadota bacterium]|nr:hypothetical protein [Pseudomonadota bacterium]
MAAHGAGKGKANGPAGLQRANRCIFRRLLRNDERMDYTLGIDATQIVADKREAPTPYKILWGGGVRSPLWQSEVAYPSTLETAMQAGADQPQAPAAIALLHLPHRSWRDVRRMGTPPIGLA